MDNPFEHVHKRHWASSVKLDLVMDQLHDHELVDTAMKMDSRTRKKEMVSLGLIKASQRHQTEQFEYRLQPAVLEMGRYWDDERMGHDGTSEYPAVEGSEAVIDMDLKLEMLKRETLLYRVP